MEFNPKGAIQQLQQVEKTLRRIEENIRQTNKINKDEKRYQERKARQLRRTQGVLKKAGEAASRGTRKRQAISTPKQVPHKMSENVLGRFVQARSDLDLAHGNLLDAAELIGTLRLAARTPQHSTQINALSKRTTRATNNLVKLIGKIPLSTIQEENQSYKASPPRIIEEYGMVSPGQLEDQEIDPHFQRIFPDVSERDLEEELAAILTSDNTPSTSADEIEHKSSSPPQQKAKSKRRKTPPRSPTDFEREQAKAKKMAENLAAEQDNISAALDPYGLDLGLTAQDEEDVRRELQQLMEEFQGGKRKKRKTRKRKRRRKTRKRKKKRRKRKTRRR